MDIHYVSLKGRRDANEDRHNIIINMNNKNPNQHPVNFFSVYDGHGGSFVSTFLEKNLPNLFMDKKVVYPLTKKYITNAYDFIQNTLKEKHRRQAIQCGSTCLVCLQQKKGDKEYITVMNTGDSRGVLCRDNFAIAMSRDHKPNWPEERRRIEKLGGEIYTDGTDYRIGMLSVSRAFGDIDAAPFVTHQPDIFQYKLEPTDKFMILACDGLWDVFTNQDAINFVLDNCYDANLETRVNKKINIAKKLGEFAINKGSQDNISIVIVFFS